MSKKKAMAALTALSFILTLSACSLAPRGKTVILHTPQANPSATAAAAPGAIGLIAVNTINLDQLDQAGYITGYNIVSGWLDNNRLIAIGTAPIQASSGEQQAAQPAPDQALLQQKVAKIGHLSAKGITGKILAVDWKSNKTESLHELQNTVYTRMGLSHDKTKLWYITVDTDDQSELTVSDISFTRTAPIAQNYYAISPTWSSLDKYLCYFYYAKDKRSSPRIMLYDGTTSAPLPSSEIEFNGLNLFNIDDKTNTAYSIIKDAIIVSLPLSKPNTKYVTDSPFGIRGFAKGQSVPTITKTVWIGANYVLMQGWGSGDTQSLGILDVDSNGPPYWYDDISNFAVSDDGKYVCLVREVAPEKPKDIKIAELKNGQITNETPIYKGFNAMESIFFSPDSTKVFLSGYTYLSKTPSAIVVQFR